MNNKYQVNSLGMDYFISSPLFIQNNLLLNGSFDSILFQARLFNLKLVEYLMLIKQTYKNVTLKNNSLFIGYYFKEKIDAENHVNLLNKKYLIFVFNYFPF